MNIVRINCGLGNQMFQYAFYLMLKKLNSETKLDISEFKYRKYHNGYELERIFNINPTYATKKECDKIADVSKRLLDEIRRDFLKIRKKSVGKLIAETDANLNYKEHLLKETNSFFIGYWQSEKYFLPISDSIRNEFTFKNELDPDNLAVKEHIEQTNSVSIHIRRGDYMKKRRVGNIGSVCSLSYFEKAIGLITQKVNTPIFFVFSDDVPWAKENLKIDNVRYIDINYGNNSYKDMQLMSLCKHNIISNSTFSWWGAWLNNNANKIVCAPSIWFRDIKMVDIIPDKWQKIEV